jgi:hypothetical protein
MDEEDLEEFGIAPKQGIPPMTPLSRAGALLQHSAHPTARLCAARAALAVRATEQYRTAGETGSETAVTEGAAAKRKALSAEDSRALSYLQDLVRPPAENKGARSSSARFRFAILSAAAHGAQ